MDGRNKLGRPRVSSDAIYRLITLHLATIIVLDESGLILSYITRHMCVLENMYGRVEEEEAFCTSWRF